MITPEAVIVVIGWAVSMATALLVVPKLAAARTMRKFGLVPVRNSKGEEIYAVEGPDGEPIKVPVQTVDAKGVVSVSNEFVPLAYALPVIAAVQTKAFLMSTIQGKAGRLVQQANEAVIADMPLEQAASAMAMQAFAKGQYGKALMAYLTPRIAAALNQSGNAGQALNPTSNQTTRSGGGRAI